jgi:hypothetical protein
MCCVNKPTDIAKSEEVAKLVNQDSYTFIATRAYPMDQSTINNVMSVMRPAGAAAALF